MDKERFIYSVLGSLLILPILFTGFISNNHSSEEYIDSLTFFASFDHGKDADFASGDSTFYQARSWANRHQHIPFSESPHVEIHQDEGVYRNALWIDNSYTPVFLYRADQNVTYSETNWSGTVSFWMRLSPDEDLPDGFSDPIQITSREWNDGALFVDFTDQIPRVFRFAMFADRDVWDPDKRDWDDVPVEERPMIDVENHPFQHDEWTHIAFSFQNFNTGDSNGIVDGYINGIHTGTLSDREQTITWSPEEVFIWLGYNYRGYLDEIAIFDRALSESEIRSIYTLPNGIGELLD